MYNFFQIFHWFQIETTLGTSKCIYRYCFFLSRRAPWHTRRSASQKLSTLIPSISLTKRTSSNSLQSVKMIWYRGQEAVDATRKASKDPVTSVEYWYSTVGYWNRTVKTSYFNDLVTERNIINCWRCGIYYERDLMYDRWR